jgi:hypothetical protein
VYPVAPSYKPSEPPAFYNPYFDLSPVLIPNKRLDPIKAALVLKGFNKDDQYTGNAYDLLDDKIRTFFSLCYYGKMRPLQFAAIFPQILTGKARDYSLHYVSLENDFYSAYIKIKMHFDTNVNYYYYYTNWTIITLSKMKQENFDQTLH